MRRGRIAIVLSGVVVALAAWFVVRAVEQRNFSRELAQARADFAARRFGAARVRLTRLAERRPFDSDVQFMLGACEKLRGRLDAALAAWSRIPESSTQGPMALLARSRVAIDLGRFRLAETCLERAAHEPGAVGSEAANLLGWLYWITGRRQDHRALIAQQLPQATDPTPLLRTLWSMEYDHYPLESITQTLEKAYAAAPNDDRVWLALANMQIRTGNFAAAHDWLTRCERASPDDPAVLRSFLEWAEAAGRPDEAERIADRISASELTPEFLLRLRAWLAEFAGDRKAERALLERLAAFEPWRAAIYERLADIAAQDGATAAIAELRRRKAQAADALLHYRDLINGPDLSAHVAELARTAEACGRWLDARYWWLFAARRDTALAKESAAALNRIAAASPPTEPDRRSLAAVLGSFATRDPEETPAGPKLTIPIFADEAAQRGLTLTFATGQSDLHQMPESMSGGVALIDFDGDGWLDVYALQGGPFPPPASKVAFGDRLFRNRGGGQFEDVTARAGLLALPGGYSHGAAVGDYDNDGRPDLFVTRWRSYALYHNRGDGTFEEVTSRAGLAGDRDWPTSAAWADLDGDGDLDLYVCHYLVWDSAHPTLCQKQGQFGSEHAYCEPSSFPALADHVFRNDKGRFVDITKEAGFVDRNGRGLGVVAADLDDDGRVDIFVANDTTANYFYHNKGGWRFEEKGEEAGLAASATGGYLAGMGVAYGDLDGDGRLDLAVTNFFGESTTLYHNHGGGIYSDRGVAAGLSGATRVVLGFGLAALDANNDGRLDLAQANGHVEDYRPRLPYQMPAQLFLGDGHGGLIDASNRAGAPWRVPRVARGLAVGDIDNDGRTDVLIVGRDAPLALLRNQPAAGGHWLTLALEGTVSNRDAVGARVMVTAGGRSHVVPRFGGGSYLSASDPRLHIGLGDAGRAEKVEVRWPSGRRDVYENLVADAAYRLREGDLTPRPLAGFGGAKHDR